MNILSKTELAALIDHTLLKPEATKDQIEKLCKEALEYKMGAICVNPCWLPFCKDVLAGQAIKICTVIGFPLGCISTRMKAFEASEAINDGADEIDMVMNIGFFKTQEFKKVEEDIRQTKLAAAGAIVKVILETCLLSDDEKVMACKISMNGGADFVKTSTGFNKHGATLADVALMRRVVGMGMGVKAAGGIRNLEDAMAMLNAGASRLGTSSSVQILSSIDP